MTLNIFYGNTASEQAFVALLHERGVLSLAWSVEHTACTDWVVAGSVEIEVETEPGNIEIVLDDDLDRWLYHLADHLLPDDTSGRLFLDVPTRTVTWTTKFVPDWAEGGWFHEELAQCPIYRVG